MRMLHAAAGALLALAALSSLAVTGEKGKSYPTVGKLEPADPRFDQLIPKGAKLEKLAEGFIWTEGPVWVKKGGYLLFSDIPNNVVNKWEEGKGFSAFLSSGGKLSLERCLSLPTNERALRRARRDHWLRAAWREVDPALSPWRRSEALAVEINRFQTSKWVRWSKLCSVIVLSCTSWAPRARSAWAKARFACAWARLACAWSSDVTNGRLSMVNRRSPLLTIWPSVKCTWSR